MERALQIMIETCLDIANHVISVARIRPPTSYSDMFRVLSENNIIDQELAATMEKMAKFRNIIVHQYEQVDAEIVILRKHLLDFSLYNGAIVRPSHLCVFLSW